MQFLYIVTTNGFALNHDKSLQIVFFCVKRQAKNDFPKDVEKTVVDILPQDFAIILKNLIHLVVIA